MPSNYKKLGPYIREVNVRNNDLKVTLLLGVSVQKVFIPSIANTVGTDFGKYKIVRHKQFTYIADTSRRGDKIGLSFLDEHNEALVSSAYTVFEVIDHDELDPEYLMMWFRRPEFDRYARFKSHGSVREIFDWDEMCEVELPIPHIDVQRAMVKEYNTITDRITLNEQLNQKMEETAQTLYKRWFVDFEFPYDFEKDEPSIKGQSYKSNGGEMEWCEELGKEIPRGWKVDKLVNRTTKIGSGSTPRGGKDSYQKAGISLIRSMNVHDFQFRFKDLAFINDEQAKKLSNVEVIENDVLLNITGASVARCSIVPKDVLPARVNQHVAIIRMNETESSTYVLCALCSTDYKKRLLGVSESGSTREAITKEDIQNFEMLFPNHDVLGQFGNKLDILFNSREIATFENDILGNLKELTLSKMAKVNAKSIEYGTV